MDITYRFSDQLNEIMTALSSAQSEMAGAKKDATNPHFKSKYADLESVWEACRQPLAKHGICVVQMPSANGPTVTVTTMLGHKSGQWIASDLAVTAQQNTPQGVGSAITYGRRYGLAAMAGIAPEDDDGNAASDKNGAEQKPKAEPKPQPHSKPVAVEVSYNSPKTLSEFQAAIQRAEPVISSSVYSQILTDEGFSKGVEYISTTEDARRVYELMKIAARQAKKGAA
jgi:hypothetical protein